MANQKIEEVSQIEHIVKKKCIVFKNHKFIEFNLIVYIPINQLTLDLAELNTISEELKRPRNIDAILLQKKRIETELTNLRAQLANTNTEAPKVRSGNNEAKRYECEISNYAWDQSDKFVKFFISLDGVQNAAEENVTVTFTPNSILLKVTNVQNKDHKFEVKNLLHDIDVNSSYRKIKTNSVAIYAKKASEGQYLIIKSVLI